MKRLASVGLVALSVGCAHGPGAQAGDSPERVYRRYVHLVTRRQYSDAWQLLGPDVRATLDEATFARRQDEFLDGGRTYPEPRAAPIDVTLPLKDGATVILRQIDGQWRIERALEDPYAQRDPLTALRSFAAAVRDRRYDVLLRFVPLPLRARTSSDALRTAWEGAARTTLLAEIDALEQSWSTAVVSTAHHQAKVRWGNRYEAQLSESDGMWTVEKLR